MGLKAAYVTSAADASASSPAGNTPVEIVGRTFLLRGDRPYYALFHSALQCAANNSTWELRLYDELAAAAIADVGRRSRTANDIVPVTCLRRFQPGWGKRRLRLDVRSGNDSNTITGHGGDIAILEGDGTEQYAEQIGGTSTTETAANKQTRVSVTVSEGGGDDWLIFACCEGASGTQQRFNCELFDGTTAYGGPEVLDHQGSSIPYPWSTHEVQNFSGSRTFSLRFWSTNGTSVTISKAVILAIRLPAASDSASDRTKTSSSSATAAVKATATLDPAAARPHLVLGHIVTDTAGGGGPQYSDLTAGGNAVDPEAVQTSISATPDTINAHMTIDEVPSAGARSWEIRGRANGTISVGRHGAIVTAIELAPLTPFPARPRPVLHL